MSDTISQDEINALFSQAESAGTPASSSQGLDDTEKDVLGEVGNISMGSAATTLSALLNQKVTITTPMVKGGKDLNTIFDMNEKYVAVDIKYKAGLEGSFLLIIKESDAQKISNIMMGSPADAPGEIGEIQLSALSEAMNQMVGTSCTSMSQVFDSTIDINPPVVTKIDFSTSMNIGSMDLSSGDYAIVQFDLEVENIIKSKMLQILPLNMAKGLISKLLGTRSASQTASAPSSNAATQSTLPPNDLFVESDDSYDEKPAIFDEPEMPRQTARTVARPQGGGISHASSTAQNVEFETLLEQRVEATKEQISLIQDVPLEVVVELGRTSKSIKEILEFGPGVVIELNKMAGEPIDILINNKFIAKGEVVVIDENFGIRITEIVDVKKRI